jgi:hypothetical protein
MAQSRPAENFVDFRDGITGQNSFRPILAVPLVHEPGNKPDNSSPHNILVNSFIIPDNDASGLFGHSSRLIKYSRRIKPVM